MSEWDTVFLIRDSLFVILIFPKCLISEAFSSVLVSQNKALPASEAAFLKWQLCIPGTKVSLLLLASYSDTLFHFAVKSHPM